MVPRFEAGGAELQAVAQVSLMRAAGDTAGLVAWSADAEATTAFAPVRPVRLRTGSALVKLATLRSHLRVTQPDVVVSRVWTANVITQAAIGSMPLRLRPLHVLVEDSVPTEFVLTKRHPRSTSTVLRRAYARADRVACVSERSRQSVLRLQPDARAFVLPPIADPPLGPRVAVPAELRIATVANLKPSKDPLGTLQWLSDLVPQAFSWDVYGRGSEDEKLRRAARQRAHISLEVRPFVGRLRDHLLAATAGVHGSPTEGFGLGLLDLLLAGVPVVTRRPYGIHTYDSTKPFLHVPASAEVFTKRGLESLPRPSETQRRAMLDEFSRDGHLRRLRAALEASGPM